MSLTDKQRRLFGWVYACKTGKSKKCPSRIKKIGKNISKAKLRKCLKENYVYFIPRSRKVKAVLEMMMNGIKFKRTENFIIVDTDSVKDKINFYKIVKENGMKLINENYLSLDNITGMGDVISPTQDNLGSGDKFQSLDFETNRRLSLLNKRIKKRLEKRKFRVK